MHMPCEGVSTKDLMAWLAVFTAEGKQRPATNPGNVLLAWSRERVSMLLALPKKSVTTPTHDTASYAQIIPCHCNEAEGIATCIQSGRCLGTHDSACSILSVS